MHVAVRGEHRGRVVHSTAGAAAATGAAATAAARATGTAAAVRAAAAGIASAAVLDHRRDIRRSPHAHVGHGRAQREVSYRHLERQRHDQGFG